MRQEIVKVYGSVYPAGPAMEAAARSVLSLWDLDGSVEREGDLLRLAHEGVFFPLADVLDALSPFFGPDTAGRIDFIDLEAWTLTRFRIEGRAVVKSRRGLNDVLAYSGW